MGNFHSNELLDADNIFYSQFFYCSCLFAPFQITLVILIIHKILAIKDDSKNISYCFISLWMMYLFLAIFVMYIISSVFLISLHILDANGMYYCWYWKVILSWIGELNVLAGDLTGCFLMAQAFEWIQINTIIEHQKNKS